MAESHLKEKKFSNLVKRRDYTKVAVPNLDDNEHFIEQLREAYQKLLDGELRKLILSFFPISHEKNPKYEVLCKGVVIGKPEKDIEFCIKNSVNYEVPVYANIQLLNKETGEVAKDKKNENMRLFFIPLMTPNGTFIINGVEKVVFNQIVKAPGIYAFENSLIRLVGKKKETNTITVEILPYRGILTHFTYESYQNSGTDGFIAVQFRSPMGTKVHKCASTIFLKALGFNSSKILEIFDNNPAISNTLNNESYNYETITNDFRYVNLLEAMNSVEKAEDKYKIGSPLEIRIKKAILKFEGMSNKASEEAKEVLDVIISEIAAMELIEGIGIGTKQYENVASEKNLYCFQDILCRQFLDPKIYQLSKAGRYKINMKCRISDRIYSSELAEDLYLKNGDKLFPKNQLLLYNEYETLKENLEKKHISFSKKLEVSSKTSKYGADKQTFNVESVNIYGAHGVKVPVIAPSIESEDDSLTIGDILGAMSYLIGLSHDIGTYDDIEDISNKRVRLSAEQLYSKINSGMLKVQSATKERLSSLFISETAKTNADTVKKIENKTTIKNVFCNPAINAWGDTLLDGVIQSFFNTYSLTNFVDQTNPLSEITNKRRITLTGEGGVSVEDPNLSVRDVHISQYGRICPTETPEGRNVGLVLSLASFAKIDENGFIKAPYKVVKNGKVTDEIVWIDAANEKNKVICQSKEPMDASGKLLNPLITARFRQTYDTFTPEQIDLIDASPAEILSYSASLVPFVESDDGIRVAYGCNQERQSLPLIKPYAAIVSTGRDYAVAKQSYCSVTAQKAGVVTKVDANNISVKTEDGIVNYPLIKYKRSNQETAFNQTPVVNKGDEVSKGQLLADGPAMQNGEIALGSNPLVAFMFYKGFNYEDAIVISDRLVKEDLYTSINIQEFECEAIMNRDSGSDEITRDIPNLPEKYKYSLDKNGLVLVGTYVEEGDILVGKITPKKNVTSSSSLDLFDALLGAKSLEYKDTSLRVPHNVSGIVIKVEKVEPAKGRADVLEKYVVQIAQKRKIEVGDKLSNKHGNKGCISVVVPEADMPHLEDGTPIDICFSPTGVPARMNLGQTYETHLGLAMRIIGKKKLLQMLRKDASEETISNEFGLSIDKVISLKKTASHYLSSLKDDSFDNLNDLDIILRSAGLLDEDISYKAMTPSFNGATLEDIFAAHEEAGLNPVENKGKVTLIDGITGEKYAEKISIGVMHVMKLNHMVSDKLHARDVGPYSLITCQPAGGRAQNGGQRVGEMEVWSFEGYGAAYNLRELMTIKSDDTRGRDAMFKSIIYNKHFPNPGMPESFKALLKYLQALGVGMSCVDNTGNTYDMDVYNSSYKDEENKDSVYKTQGGIIK